MNIKDLETGLVLSVRDCMVLNAGNDYQPMCQLKEGAVIQIRELVPDRNLVLITPEPMPLAVHIDSLKGIAITPDLLVKMGFAYDSDFTFSDYPISMSAYIKNIAGQDIIVVEHGDDFCLAYKESNLIVVKHIHNLQLQVREKCNSFLALSGSDFL